MATIGKNILENLTTGMYSDSKVAYREYIQNACDQIDKAIVEGLIKKEEALIDIFIDNQKRYISIKDNATGVKENIFKNELGDIANSNKQLGENKGFRGIGRLCGLAYCKTLKFSTSYKGENVASIMICDAQKMRTMLMESKKYTVDEILENIVKFESKNEEIDSHYFEVELIEINKENTDLLDEKKVKEYLNFVAPVPYKNTFIFREKIYEHAEKIQYKIDEYTVKVNGEQIFKEYTTYLKEKSGNNLKNYDEITNLEFKDFYSKESNLIAWMWVGISRFEKNIPVNNVMRSIRIRQSNIQLGGEDTLQHLFNERRGIFYFVGEVFAVDKNLIPNSQRNYFNENEQRVEFEDLLKFYFSDSLRKLYYDANKIKNANKKIAEYHSKKNEYEEKNHQSKFIDDDERQKSQLEIESAKQDANDATKQLEKFSAVSESSPIHEVYKNYDKKFNLNEQISNVTDIGQSYENNKPFITQKFSKLTKTERKLVTKILAIISEFASREIAEKIFNKIEEELK